MSDEFKHCPFCGDEAELTVRPVDLVGWDDGVGYTVSCKGMIDSDCCGSYLFDFKTKAWAIEQWNRRPENRDK